MTSGGFRRHPIGSAVGLLSGLGTAALVVLAAAGIHRTLAVWGILVINLVFLVFVVVAARREAPRPDEPEVT